MPANVWPWAFLAPPIEDPAAATGKGPRNTLILQNRLDNRAAFAGVDNGGHYVYHEGSACADKATADFLNTGHLPDQDTNCTGVTRR